MSAKDSAPSSGSSGCPGPRQGIDSTANHSTTGTCRRQTVVRGIPISREMRGPPHATTAPLRRATWLPAGCAGPRRVPGHTTPGPHFHTLTMALAYQLAALSTTSRHSGGWKGSLQPVVAPKDGPNCPLSGEATRRLGSPLPRRRRMHYTTCYYGDECDTKASYKVQAAKKDMRRARSG